MVEDENKSCPACGNLMKKTNSGWKCQNDSSNNEYKGKNVMIFFIDF